jgi:uncharacterized linocin/CFP29 family protein
MPNDPQVPWADEQWARVNQVIQEEAGRARVAATFLPLYGPLPADTDFVRAGDISYPPPRVPPPAQHIAINDRSVIQLATLQVLVDVRGAQMADPEMTSVLALFRRAANVLARLEDAVVFRGLIANPFPPPPHFTPPASAVFGLPQIWEISGGQVSAGLLAPPGHLPIGVHPRRLPPGWPGGPLPDLVAAVSDAIGELERHGQFGPYAVAFGQGYFLAVQTPDAASLVLPQDRVIPFLGGGSLHRSSTLPADEGVVVALGGTPVELVVAQDVSLQFLQVTNQPRYLFRVRETMALRIKEPEAIARLSNAAE